MGRTLDQIMDALPEERRQTIEARADELLAEVEGLKALRAFEGVVNFHSISFRFGAGTPGSALCNGYLPTNFSNSGLFS